MHNVSIVMVLRHIFVHTAELGNSLLGNNLELAVGPGTYALVLISELDRELVAASRSLAVGIGSLLVEGGNLSIKLLLGLLGVSPDLASIDGDMLIGGQRNVEPVSFAFYKLPMIGTKQPYEQISYATMAIACN